MNVLSHIRQSVSTYDDDILDSKNNDSDELNENIVI